MNNILISPSSFGQINSKPNDLIKENGFEIDYIHNHVLGGITFQDETATDGKHYLMVRSVAAKDKYG